MKVCLIKMDERTSQSVSLVFKHRTNDAISVSDEDLADIALIDLDSDGALESYRSIRAGRPDLLAIGISSKHGIECDDVLAIQKPISANRLLDAFRQISGRDFQIPMVQAVRVASSLSERTRSAKRRTENAGPVEGECFDPDTCLMGVILTALKQAGQEDKIAVVRLSGARIILLDPQSKMIQTNCSQARLLSLFAAGMESSGGSNEQDETGHATYDLVSRDQARELFDGKTYGMPREQLMWRLGWLSSQGRLPMGVEVEQRFYLKRWPNMTHLGCSAEEMRIVAYWVRQAASLSEIAEALDMPEQEVFRVYTAAFAAGLCGSVQREVDTVWQAPEVAEHKERGLFSTIMKHLIGRKPAANDKVGNDEELAA